MKIKDVMTRDVEVITPDTSLVEAAEKMRSLDVGPLPVCMGDKVLGVVTDRDIVVRGVALGRDVRSTKVSEVMTSGAEFCFENDSVREAADVMKEKQIRRLLVLDKSKKLVGIVSIGDLAVDSSDRVAGKTLEKISEPAEPARH